MPLTRLDILGLRGFQAEQTFQPAIPNGKPGSGLTVVIGPNNAGKSIVIEALRAIVTPEAGGSFPERLRNANVDGRVRIRSWYGPDQYLTLETFGGSQIQWSHEGSFTAAQPLVIPSRRGFGSRL